MRHFTRDRSPFRVRLACVKHAASVQSEPESNSPVQICSKDLRWTEIRISKFLPVRYSLVNEPRRSTRREAVVYAASFSLSTSFFISRKFFRGPAGATRWRKGDICLIFKPASRTFLPSGKISFPVALADMASSLARTALCAFSATPSSIFPQKILHSCPQPALPFPACRKDTPGYRHPLCRFPAVCGLKTTPLPAERAVSAGDKHRKPEKTFPYSPSRSCQGSTAKQGNPYRARCSAPPLLAITALVKSCQRKRERTRET